MEKQYTLERALDGPEMSQKVYAVGLVINNGMQFRVYLVRAESPQEAARISADKVQKESPKENFSIQAIWQEYTLGELLPLKLVEVTLADKTKNILMQKILTNNDIELYLVNLEKFCEEEKTLLRNNLHL